MSKHEGPVPHWYAETRDGDFEIGLDSDTKHSGANSAYIKSLNSHPKNFGNLTNRFSGADHDGKRIKMTAWVKSEVTSGSAQLWLRIDGNWQSGERAGCFDNMDDRPIKGTTTWNKYSLVCDVPKESTEIVFGMFLNGTGKAWLDDVSFEAVGDEVPCTGAYCAPPSNRGAAKNLNFDDALDTSNGAPERGVEQIVKHAEDIYEWELEPKDEFEIGLDKEQKHSGTRSAYIKSVAPAPKDFGQISQPFVPNNYLGKRIELMAWAKTRLQSGTAQLWIRVDGDWTNMYRRGCFDNMDDRPITGDTEWKEYKLVVDVPKESDHVTFGAFLNGTGQIWIDDFQLRIVDKSTPLTGCYAELKGCGKKEPVNMSFEEKTKN